MQGTMARARFDGGFNRTHASAACVIEKDGAEIYRKSIYLGSGDHLTNNVAEFAGMKLILEYLSSNPMPCIIIGDSTVVINRMQAWGMNPGGGTCASMALECKMLAAAIRSPIEYLWQKRTRNEECDAMCGLEIEDALSKEWSAQFSYARVQT